MGGFRLAAAAAPWAEPKSRRRPAGWPQWEAPPGPRRAAGAGCSAAGAPSEPVGGSAIAPVGCAEAEAALAGILLAILQRKRET